MSAPVVTPNVMQRIKDKVKMRRAATVGAAKIIRPGQLRTLPAPRDWQTLAWDFLDCIGEYRQAIMWRATYAGRCPIYAGKVNPNGDGAPDPLPEGDRAVRPAAEMFNGPVGTAEAVKRIVIHLGVPGETYVVAADLPGESQRTWGVFSNEELVRTQRSVKIRPPDSDELITIPVVEEALILRIWEKHGRRAWEADSASRAAIPVLGMIQAIMARSHAELQSRLKGGGLLELAEGATLPAPPDPEDGDEPLHEDPDMAVLIEAMVTPIHDRESASAVVPIIARVPDQVAGKAIKWHDFAVALDERLDPLLQRCLSRLGAMLDCSPERITNGLGDTNHWNGVLITEDEANAYISPVLQSVCNALTTGYYRPALEAMGVANPEQYQLWFNLAPIVQRPNKATEARELNSAGKVSDAVARREAGFSEEDAMTPAEHLQYLIESLALKGISPDVVAPYLRALGIPITSTAPLVPGAVPLPSGGQPALPASPAATPAADVGRQSVPGPIPDTRPAAAVGDVNRWWLTAIELCVLRALEVAGNRLNSRTPRPNRPAASTPPWLMHTLVPLRADNDMGRILDGAFTLLRVVLDEDPAARETVEEYVRQLVGTRQPHRTEWLTDALRRSGVVCRD